MPAAPVRLAVRAQALVGFDEAGGYNQADAEGFIKLNALRLRIAANLKNERAAKATPARKPTSKKKA